MEKLSHELRRFIQSIPSIPQLEAMLLLHFERNAVWDSQSLAQRLYLDRDTAEKLLEALSVLGICKLVEQPERFTYAANENGLDEMLGQLARYYASHLIEVTHIIHSKSNAGSRVQQFADAFKFKKE